MPRQDDCSIDTKIEAIQKRMKFYYIQLVVYAIIAVSAGGAVWFFGNTISSLREVLEMSAPYVAAATVALMLFCITLARLVQETKRLNELEDYRDERSQYTKEALSSQEVMAEVERRERDIKSRYLKLYHWWRPVVEYASIVSLVAFVHATIVVVSTLDTLNRSTVTSFAMWTYAALTALTLSLAAVVFAQVMKCREADMVAQERYLGRIVATHDDSTVEGSARQ